ncbi:MAG: hypothetical protein SF066_06475 [Thermoanaerobaculia bacterium]|nr:hypothetical protein [Thermoanaerobaculia bacterium]
MNSCRGLVFGWWLLSALPSIVSAQELWRGDEGQCPAEVTFEAGFLTVVRGPGPAVLTALAPGFEFTATGTGEAPRLALRAAREVATQAHAQLQVPGQCALRVTSGEGHITLLGGTRAPLNVETTTGTIVLCIEEPTDLDLSFATSGELTVDFSVTLDYDPHQEPAKKGSIRLRSGAPLAVIPVSLTSRQGAIRTIDCQLPRRPLPPRPEARK